MHASAIRDAPDVPDMPQSAQPRLHLCNGPEAQEGHRELAALLHQVRGGCRVAFAAVYERTSARLFGIVLRINGDRGDSEDVLQEVYVNVWRHAGQFEAGKGQPLHWMAGIAHNAALTSLRTRRSRPTLRAHGSVEDDADPYASLASTLPTPDDTFRRGRATDAVHRSLRALPCDQRECLSLAFFDGLSHREIADRMGRPLGTIKSWVRRSLVAMRPALAHHRDATRGAECGTTH